MRAVRRRYRVRGRVQGVGFRWWVRQRAQSLGIGGWVKNLPDGTVLVDAVGEAGKLDRLAEVLGHGPAAARVDGVGQEEPSADENEGLDTEGAKTFEIR